MLFFAGYIVYVCMWMLKNSHISKVGYKLPLIIEF